ncbi:unnamed protein product [Camellia sinensis]
MGRPRVGGSWCSAAMEIAFDQSSRSTLQVGIDKLDDAVGLTLGPRDIS